MSHAYRTDSVADLDIGKVTRLILKGYSYAIYGLLVLIDGLNNPESFETKLLTIPYFIGGFALVRSFCSALDGHYDLHAGIFMSGILTLGALA